MDGRRQRRCVGPCADGFPASEGDGDDDTCFSVGRSTGNVVMTATGVRSGARLAPWQVLIAQAEMARQIRGRLRIGDVAERLHISPTHFAKAFKNSVGMTPDCWYQRARITMSMQLLRDTPSTLTEVAIECGFTDESHFITCFSRLVGVTPGRWRRRERKNGSD